MTLDLDMFTRQLSWLEGGTNLFDEAVENLDQTAPKKETLLRSWSVAHLISHVNSNARALINLTIWANTGVETPMYKSNDDRAREIEKGANLTIAQLLEDFRETSSNLWSAINSMSPEALGAVVKSARGRDIPASEIVWMRNREVWVHAVDLDTNASFAQFPEGLLDAMITEAAASFCTRDNVPSLKLIASDGAGSWLTSKSGEPTEVEGPKAELLAWMIGRSRGDRLRFATQDKLPVEMPEWL